MQSADLVIIGAGPAGMSAAVTASKAGLSVIVLDEQAHPGGQIYRNIDQVTEKRAKILGSDYLKGRTLTDALSQSNVTHIAGAVVWAIEDGYRVTYTRDGVAAQVSADKLILATGALERPMPLPGWTLPGVMTAGAAQIMLKQSGLLCRRAVLVGSGPLLYLVAAQMLRAGTPPLAIVETQTRADLTRAAKHSGGAMRGWRYLAKGLRLIAEITRARVPRYKAATGIVIQGDTHAKAISFDSGGRRHQIACDTVLLHHGVVPNTQIARSLRIAHRWNSAQRCFEPVLDEHGQSDVAGVFVTGDSAGIGGAESAAISGQIAALRIIAQSGAETPTHATQAKTLLRQRAAELAIRPFLDEAYPPCLQALNPAPTTLICRCEEITAGDIRSFAALGCQGANQAKAFGRVGMGPCQGRYCGLSVTEVLADATGATPQDIGYFRIRPPIKPVTLGEISGLEE